MLKLVKRDIQANCCLPCRHRLYLWTQRLEKPRVLWICSIQLPFDFQFRILVNGMECSWNLKCKLHMWKWINLNIESEKWLKSAQHSTKCLYVHEAFANRYEYVCEAWGMFVMGCSREYACAMPMPFIYEPTLIVLLNIIMLWIMVTDSQS